MRFIFLIFVVISSVPLHSQVVQVDAGAGSFSPITGGKAALYFPNQTITLSGGAAYGRVVGGLSDAFTWQGSKIVMGSQAFYGAIDASGLALTGVGISAQRGTVDNSYGCFLGSEGIGSSFQYLMGYLPQHIGVACFLHKKLSERWRAGTLVGLQGGQRTAVQSIAYSSSKLKLTGSGGVLYNEKSATGIVDWSPNQPLHFNLSHTEAFVPYNEEQLLLVSEDSAGAFASLGRFTVSGVVMQTTSDGHTVLGYVSGVAGRFSFITTRVDLYHSNSSQTINYTLQENLGRHIALSEVVSQDKTFSVSGGGTYRTNNFSIGLQDSVAFIPFVAQGQQAGFSQIKSINVSLRIPHTDAAIQTEGLIVPAQKIKWSASASDYTHGPFDLAGSQGPRKEFRAANGKYVIRGVVHQKNTGEVLEGVAVQIGRQLVFSNGSGVLFTRTKTKEAVTVKVLPEEFAGAGRIRVVNAPATAIPDQLVEIEVELF